MLHECYMGEAIHETKIFLFTCTHRIGIRVHSDTMMGWSDIFSCARAHGSHTGCDVVIYVLLAKTDRQQEQTCSKLHTKFQVIQTNHSCSGGLPQSQTYHLGLSKNTGKTTCNGVALVSKRHHKLWGVPGIPHFGQNKHKQTTLVIISFLISCFFFF